MEDPQFKQHLVRAINNDLDLNYFYNREEFIKQTAQQVIKDFGQFGIEIQFSGDIENAYNELFDQLNVVLHDVLEKNQETLMNLLYRIDVSVKSFHQQKMIHPDLDQMELLTDVIIKRELKKVLLRYYFKHYQD